MRYENLGCNLASGLQQEVPSITRILSALLSVVARSLLDGKGKTHTSLSSLKFDMRLLCSGFHPA